MSRTSRWAATALIVSCAACHGKQSPTAPTVASSAPPARALKSAYIDGPTSIPPGGTAQFRYMKVYTNGMTEDATSDVSWISNNPRVLTIDRGGLATGVGRGSASVIAVSGIAPSRFVLVLEDGTFRLTGQVNEDGLPVTDVLITVTRGVGQGLVATTGFGGQYALFGVAGDVELRASHDGYAPVTQSIVVTGNTTAPDFSIHEVSGPPDLSGDWTMSVTRSTACQSASDITSRSYRATISQFGAKATMTLASDALSKPVAVVVHVTNTEIDFTLDEFVDYYSTLNPTYALLEALDGQRYLGMAGLAHLVGSTRLLTGALRGSWDLYSGTTYAASKLVASCYNAEHPVTLAR